MEKYMSEGGNKWQGEVNVSGSKNASLPIIAACILNKGITKLYNVPKIKDTKIMFKILESLGGKIKILKNKVVIDTSKINSYKIPENLMHELRSSIIIVGSLISTYKQATFSYPGGCDIGKRPIDMHLKVFENLGVNINENYGNIICNCDKIEGGNIQLDFPSVGATENAILASILADGTTIISNAAMEPAIKDLQEFLNKMGAKVIGAGSNTIKVIGVKKLKNISYNIMPDRIEAGTLLCAAAITNGYIKVNNIKSEYINPILIKLEEAGCKIHINYDNVELLGPKRLKAVDIKTAPYPGFPTDMQSIFASIQVVAKGTSIIVENIFENRYKYIDELIKMGAKVTIEGKIAIIKGVKKLHSATVYATDLRGGAALVIAALSIKNLVVIQNIKYILRGYEDLDIKLNSIGAKINRVKE